MKWELLKRVENRFRCQESVDWNFASLQHICAGVFFRELRKVLNNTELHNCCNITHRLVNNLKALRPMPEVSSPISWFPWCGWIPTASVHVLLNTVSLLLFQDDLNCMMTNLPKKRVPVDSYINFITKLNTWIVQLSTLCSSLHFPASPDKINVNLFDDSFFTFNNNI